MVLWLAVKTQLSSDEQMSSTAQFRRGCAMQMMKQYFSGYTPSNARNKYCAYLPQLADQREIC